LRYRLVTDANELESLFPALAWAGYYKDWDGPAVNERPTAYIVQCLDTKYGNDCLCDDGLELQAITLGAVANCLGCCIIKAFDKQKVSEVLHIPDGLTPRYVLAVGIPAETVKIVDMENEDDFKYYRDADDSQCVPKRTLNQRLIN
jgi:nitroreductase